MADEDDFVRITLRLPVALHANLTEFAAKKRSMNAEIIERLEKSFIADHGTSFAAPVVAGVTASVLAEEVASKVVDQLHGRLIRRADERADEVASRDRLIKRLAELGFSGKSKDGTSNRESGTSQTPSEIVDVEQRVREIASRLRSEIRAREAQSVANEAQLLADFADAVDALVGQSGSSDARSTSKKAV